MSLSASVRYSGGIAIYDLTGRLVSGMESDSLREILTAAFDRGHRYMLLNCEAIAYVDSSGLGELVSAYASLVRRGGAIRLLRPSQRLGDLLALTRLDSLFAIDTDEAEALAAFRAPGDSRRKLADYLSGELSAEE
jgi:anti-sigma B factor antagonist